MRMRRVTLLSVSCLAVQYFSTYLVNGTILERKKEHKMCFDFLYKIWNIFHSKENWAIYYHKRT
jgi:hypothetical protein